MKRAFEEFFGSCVLDDPAKVHNGNSAAQVADYSEIMGNHQVRQPVFPLQAFEEIQYRCLH
jgi:hypothetical protein